MALSNPLEHCIFIWDIKNISLCLDMNHLLRSPLFPMPRSSTLWYLELYTNRIENDILSTSVALHRHLFDNGPEEIAANFSLNLQLQNRNVLLDSKNNFMSYRKSSSSFVTSQITINPRKLHEFDYLCFTCEIILKVNDFELVDDIDPDLDTLLQDFMKLLNRDVGNAIVYANGESFKVHKEILSIYSSKFKTTFLSGNDFVIVPYSVETVKSMLKFIYTGDIGHNTERYPPSRELHQIAEDYNVVGLRKALEPQIKIYSATQMTLESFSYEWRILNFTEARFESDIFETEVMISKFENVNLTLKLYFDRSNTNRGIIIVYGEVRDLIQVTSLIVEMCILDNQNNIVITKFSRLHPDDDETFRFCLCLAEELIFNQANVVLPHNVLKVDFHFNYKYRDEIYISQTDLCVFCVSDTEIEDCRFSHQMRRLLQSKLYSDAKLLVSGIEMEVHKSVLGARSSVFRECFEQENEVVVQLSPTIVRHLLNYMYTGMLSVGNPREIIEIHKAAGYYRISRLEDKCHELLLKSDLTVKHVFDICCWSDRLNYQKLKRRCMKFISDNDDILLDKPSWLKFARQNKDLGEDILKCLKKN